jgi:archaellum biogenesis ATPase FlaH
MSLVLEALRKNSSMFKNREDDNREQFGAVTHFTIFDYMNAELGKTLGPNGEFESYLSKGLPANISSFIGRSATGKSSLSLRLAAGIIRTYPNSVLYIRDAEKTITKARLINLTGMSMRQLEFQVDYKRFDITHDSVYNEIRRICQWKENERSKIMINSDVTGQDGRPITMFPPDVYLIDSLPYLNPLNDDEIVSEESFKHTRDTGKELSDAVVNRRTEGLQLAGSNKLLISKIADMISRYNIRVILVNHITLNTDLNVNPRYIQKQLFALRQNEKLPGGSSYLYSCSNLTKTEFGSKLEEGEFGSRIFGFRNKITMIKNKTNVSGVPVEVIMDQRTGYNNLLSNFNYIYNRGYGLEGSPRSMSLKACPSISFTKRTLWDTLIKNIQEYPDDPQFVKALTATAQRCLYYDFVLGYPDPVKENWSGGNNVRMSYEDGVKSR